MQPSETLWDRDLFFPYKVLIQSLKENNNDCQ